MRTAMMTSPTTADLLRRNRRRISRRRLIRLPSPDTGARSSMGSLVAISTRFSVTVFPSAQSYARVEDRHHDVGEDSADQDAHAAEGGHRYRSVHVLAADRGDPVLAH